MTMTKNLDFQSGTETGEFPTTLQKVSVQVVNKVECRDIYADINEININSICAGLYGKDSCSVRVNENFDLLVDGKIP